MEMMTIKIHLRKFKSEVLKLELLFPIFILILWFSIAPFENSFNQSFQYIREHPYSAGYSIFLFTLLIPNVGFIYNKDYKPSQYQRNIIKVLYVLSFILAIYVVK